MYLSQIKPRVACKQLKASLTLAIINVDESTIKTKLNNHSVHDRAARKVCSTKRTLSSVQFDKDHMDKPEDRSEKNRII